MIIGWTGIPGCGKTYLLTEKIEELLRRNKKYFKRTKVRRLIYTNIELEKNFIEKNKDFLRSFGEYKTINDLDFMFEVPDIDIIFDEIGTYFDATQWGNLDLKFRIFFALHEHYGIDIYFGSQDFAQVDKSLRRMCEKVYYLTKLFGSPRPSATKPLVKKVWGLIFSQGLNAKGYKEDNFEKNTIPFDWKFAWLSKDITSHFDTTQKFKIVEKPISCIIKTAPCGKVIHTHK